LDSSVLIAAERQRRPLSELFASLQADFAETQFIVSAVTVMELEHGWHRANTPEVARKRREYLDEVLSIIPVESFTRQMGVLAAGIDAETKRAGRVIATADLLIGVTALYYQYSIFTHNPRHFQMIPGLKVVSI
jgi:tRNA(fMet)-specific endonuclease VapC